MQKIGWHFSLCFLVVFLLSNSLIAKNNVVFKKNCPHHWIITEKDTIDGVSRKFLLNPWRWQHAWGTHDAPHYLLPGDEIKLTEINGQKILVYIHKNHNNHTVKLGPRILVSTEKKQTINPVMSYSDVAPFLRKGKIFADKEKISHYAKIISLEKERIHGIRNSSVYVKNNSSFKIGQIFNIYRKNDSYKILKTAKSLIDTFYVGQAIILAIQKKYVQLKILSSVIEVQNHDFIMPAVNTENKKDFILHTPEKPSIIVALPELGLFKKLASVIIKGGKYKKIKRGDMFTIFTPKSSHYLGKLMVYQVFKNYSYALVLNSTGQINTNDKLIPLST